jgi:membrane associated rhomboid family serine protease
MGANISFEVSNGAVYRLITAIGLHAGIMHIFANSTSLIVFCGKVETSVTRKVYLISFILGGIQGYFIAI